MLDAALASLLADDPAVVPCDDLAAFWAVHRARIAARGATPIEAALLGGFAADRIGFAFAAGYQAALAAAFGGGAGELVSLCATEAAGAHPRAIEARLFEDGEGALRLQGRKRWSTMGTLAQALLVLAARGVDAQGRKALVLVRVSARAPGVRIAKLPDAPFAPEIPHAEVVLDGAPIEPSDVLPGDAWERYVKPFRTVEDAHVHAALLGHALALARRFASPRELVARLALLASATHGLAALAPSAPATHVALAGAIAEARGALAALEPTIVSLGGDVAARWTRDRPLLEVASKARALRLDRAFAALAGGA